MSTNSVHLDKEEVLNMLVTSAQLEAAEMFLGMKPEVLSSDAKTARDKAFDACQEAQTDAAYQAQLLQEDLEYLEDLREKIDEKQLQRAHSLIKQKEELIAKITAAEEELAGVNLTNAKKQLAANQELEEKLAKIRQKNAQLGQVFNHED